VPKEQNIVFDGALIFLQGWEEETYRINTRPLRLIHHMAPHLMRLSLNYFSYMFSWLCHSLIVQLYAYLLVQIIRKKGLDYEK